VVVDGGPWRGPDLETWVARIAAPILREGETLPLIKPLTAPVEEERAGGVSDGAESIPGVPRPVALAGWSEAELREVFGR